MNLWTIVAWHAHSQKKIYKIICKYTTLILTSFLYEKCGNQIFRSSSTWKRILCCVSEVLTCPKTVGSLSLAVVAKYTNYTCIILYTKYTKFQSFSDISEKSERRLKVVIRGETKKSDITDRVWRGSMITNPQRTPERQRFEEISAYAGAITVSSLSLA